MPVNRSVAENVLGTMGTICWTIQLIPQVWKSWREKSTKGLSHYLVLMWGIAASFLGVYAIVQNLNIPLIVQPQLFGMLSLLSWGQCLYYSNKQSRTMSIVSVIVVAAILGGFEASMVFVVRPSYNTGNQRAVQFFGIMSSMIISIALLPQYYEIYKHHEVIGISILFMTIDMAGGLFSDLSLVFKDHFDIIASITYSLVIVLDGIVLIAALILNPAARRRRRHLATSIITPSTATGTPLANPPVRSNSEQ